MNVLEKKPFCAQKEPLLFLPGAGGLYSTAQLELNSREADRKVLQ